MQKPYVIAEIGVNFYDTASVMNITPLEAAMLYIDAAKNAGADCAKFQSYKAKTLASRNSPAYWDTRKEPTQTQYDLFKKHDFFGEREYRLLCEHAHSVGIDFTSTPFDYTSADYLKDMVNFYKISSSDLNNIPFIRHIGEKKKPVCLSVGASYLSEVEEAVRALKCSGCPEVVLMHCILSYPTLPENANLQVIHTLKTVFPDLHIGYSDHCPADDSMSILSAAYLLGAEVIEKHFTLDKSLQGNDHYHAGDPDDFKTAIRNFDMIRLAMGTAEKTVFSCEEIARQEARRSLVLTRDCKAGDILVEDDLMPKRPGTGISPQHINIVLGRVLRCDVKEDTILTWDMI